MRFLEDKKIVRSTPVESEPLTPQPQKDTVSIEVSKKVYYELIQKLQYLQVHWLQDDIMKETIEKHDGVPVEKRSKRRDPTVNDVIQKLIEDIDFVSDVNIGLEHQLLAMGIKPYIYPNQSEPVTKEVQQQYKERFENRLALFKEKEKKRD